MKKKTRVLLFVDRMRHGGIQQFLVENIKNMDKTNLIIDVLTLDDGETYPLEQTIKDAGANFYKLKDIWIKKTSDYIKYAKAIDKFFKENNDYKVVHMNASSKNFLLLKYAKKYNVPIRITHSHSIDFQTKNIIKKIIGNLFKFPVKYYSTDYFACSTVAGDWLFGKKNKNKVKFIHNAVDYSKFQINNIKRETIRKNLGISNDEILLGHVGRFTNEKNHKFLIDIFYEYNKLNPKSKLLLIGIGELELEIRNKVNDLKLNNKVIFGGFKNNVNDFMQAMDFFVFPSLYEGLGIVLIEAQANGMKSFASLDVIPNEAKITDLVTFIPLKDNCKQWANTIYNSDCKKNDKKKNLINEGYIIEDTAKELKEFYEG